jgi:hypothetical protein
MATLLLQAAGASLGGLFGPVGAIVGRAAGALAGNLIDRSLISSFTTIEGSRLSTARIPGAEEGTTINRVYGTIRIGGTLIWATRFEEEVTTERSGGKATGPRIETFSYFANFAIGLCEGPIAGIRRVWADGREIDLTAIEMRLYRGTENQDADPLIEAKQGAGNAPAFRGLAYVVFERLPLDVYGNRIPVLQFEVIRTVGSLEGDIQAITLIPGATEHGYSPVQVTEKTGDASARIINRNQLYKATDWEASIDELLAVCPNLERVALVVSWFGTDLRAGHCRILPGVETDHRDEESKPWRVSGYDRATAHRISQSGGGPAYGGTPDDASVVAAIRDLQARGLAVYLYPFLMMDVPADNDLPDPYGGEKQAAYPWRGRITCHPAPGEPGDIRRIPVCIGAIPFCKTHLFRKGIQESQSLIYGTAVSFRFGGFARQISVVPSPGDSIAKCVRSALARSAGRGDLGSCEIFFSRSVGTGTSRISTHQAAVEAASKGPFLTSLGAAVRARYASRIYELEILTNP